MQLMPKTPDALLEAHGLFSAPVDVDALAAKLGLSATQEKLDDDVSGVLVVRDGKGTVIINKAQHVNRRRFTMAHEIGHYVLHWAQSDRLFLDRRYPAFGKVDDSVYLRSSSQNTSPKEEVEANDFAAALLMPKRLIQDFIKSGNLSFIDEEDVSGIAKAFGVSEQAMLIRLKRLGILKLV